MNVSAEEPEDLTADDAAAAGRIAERFAARQEKIRSFLNKNPFLRMVYRVLIIVVGALLILAGIAMLVLPGPGWLTIFLGLAVLGTEFAWARNALIWLRQKVSAMLYRWKTWRNRNHD